MSRGVIAAYAACALIWGTTWFAIRVCLAGYPVFTALALRFGLAAAILLPLAARVRPWPRGWAWLPFVAAGVLDAAGYLLVYIGEERVPGGVAAVIYGTQPLLLALFLIATRMEPLTPRDLAGAIIALGGVIVLFLDRLDVSPRQGIGVALVFCSVIISTSYSVIMKRHGGAIPNLVATAIFLGVTALVLGAVALGAGAAIPWPPPAQASLALVYLAIVGSVVAFLCYFWLLDRTSLVVAATLSFVYPLVALATDAIFEHTITLGPRAYAGVAITLAGLGVSLRRR